MSRAFKIVLAVVLASSMVVLFVVLTNASNDGKKAIGAYIASIRSGATASPEEADGESDALTVALRESTSFSISNFQSQHDTSCFWVTVRGGKEPVEVRFVLVDGSPSSRIKAVSIKRECDCPIDPGLPCALK